MKCTNCGNIEPEPMSFWAVFWIMVLTVMQFAWWIRCSKAEQEVARLSALVQVEKPK
jgi:hypothetical protein